MVTGLIESGQQVRRLGLAGRGGLTENQGQTKSWQQRAQRFYHDIRLPGETANWGWVHGLYLSGCRGEMLVGLPPGQVES